MFRRLLSAFTLVALASVVRADDALPAEVVDGVKAATVFVRVEGDGWAASGSGFVVSGDEKALFVATNHHVASPAPATAGKPGTLTVVFDSGTKTERSFPAAVASSDTDRDLAVLRVAGVKTPPKPIPLTDAPKVAETTPVYSFGFPFGKALSSDKGFPAVTVGKASVSSLRNGPDGELAAIQIDGNLNPGNSGGPVVDAKGKLVGVAQSIIREGQGIGFIVPAGELGRMMQGRAGRVRLLPPKTAGGKTTARVEVRLIDPAGNLKGASVRYLLVPPKGKRPEGDSLEKATGSQVAELKVTQGVGAADLALPAADGEVLIQVSVEPTGKTAVAGRVAAFSLALAALAGDLPPPPAGWTEFAASDKSFTMWVPEKAARQSSRERTMTVDGQRLRVNSVAGVSADGLTYEGMSVVLPPAFKGGKKELADLFVGVIADELKGRVTESKEVDAGGVTGTESVIEAGKRAARVRAFVAGGRVGVVRVSGSAEQVTGTEAETLLAAFRLPDPNAKAVAVGGRGKDPLVIGGHGAFGGAPFFKDVAPDGGLLVGLEVVIGRPFADELVRSVRPIYRTGEKESFGKQFGTTTETAVTLKAKAGYAVGGITAKARNWCDGFSLTFMKVADGKLDPADSYESEWLGWDGPMQATKVASDGTPVLGLAGRANDKDVNGIGLLFKGQEGFDPAAASKPATPAATPPGKEPTILGGAFDPVFVERVPDGGLLVGFEVGVAPAFGTTMTRSIRPIFRVNGKEVFGEQRGTQLKDVKTLKAKDGYAVGAISAMHGLGFDGITVTFMKVADGKLDPKDSYDSEYVGSDQKKPLTKLGGDGTPVIGVAGKSNDKDMTGFGLLFKGQEGFDPKKK